MVPVQPLSQICKDNCADNQTVPFLKIDVEGFEKAVVEGADILQYRPRVIVIEAIDPIKRKPVYDELEYILITNDYQFVMEQYLNRLYVDSQGLISKFKTVEEILQEYIVFQIE